MEEIFGLFGNDSLEEKKISAEFSWIFFCVADQPPLSDESGEVSLEEISEERNDWLGFFWVENKMVATRVVFLWGVFFGGRFDVCQDEKLPKKKTSCVWDVWEVCFFKAYSSDGKCKLSRFPVFAWKVTL